MQQEVQMHTGGNLWGHCLLAFGLIVVVTVEANSGTPNCKTQQCVQVGDNNGTEGDNCWITEKVKENYVGRAYSTTYAAKGYGQDSKGGTPGTDVDGYYRKISSGARDCELQDVYPSSGTAVTYQPGTTNDTYKTKCAASE